MREDIKMSLRNEIEIAINKNCADKTLQ